MGGGASSEKKEEKQMQKEIDAAEEAEASKIKLLLLGAGESGKSTIFKQMKILYGDPTMSSDDMALVRSIIHNNLITTMQTLCEYADTFGTKDEVADLEAYTLIEETDETDDLTEEVGEALKKLWADPAIQSTWERRGEFQVVESVKYYFDNLERIASTDYMSKDEYTKEDMEQYQKDALYARVRTSGIVTEKYNIDGHVFEMYDVGGQRNERRKWIHCFEDVTAVIFVAAISEYDQKLFEDGATNRMVEALELFDEICNNRCFMESSTILFLNKRDLFKEKIQTIDIADTPSFSDYTGGKDYDAGCAYFLGKFQALNKFHEKQIYHHITCATDTSNIKVVMDAAKDIILQKNMKDSGLL